MSLRTGTDICSRMFCLVVKLYTLTRVSNYIIMDTKKKNTLRTTLNALFMLGAVAAVLLYFVMPRPHTAALIVGWSAIGLKIAEFVIRLFVK